MNGFQPVVNISFKNIFLIFITSDWQGNTIKSWKKRSLKFIHVLLALVNNISQDLRL